VNYDLSPKSKGEVTAFKTTIIFYENIMTILISTEKERENEKRKGLEQALIHQK